MDGLQLVIDACSVGWVDAGASPAFTYTCTGTTQTSLAPRGVVGADSTLTGLNSLTSPLLTACAST